MQVSKNKTIATVIALFLVLTITATLVALPVANAHTPAWTVPTHCYVAPTPPLIGVNQEMIIVWWLNAVPPTAAGPFGDHWTAYVDITKPDGNKDTEGPLTSDPVGGGYIFYTPTEIGTYTVVARFPGQTVTGNPTPSGAPSTNAAVNDTYAASTSDPAYFTVQQEPIPKYVETPLPSGYWTRPIFDANRGWGSAVMGQWLGGAYYDALKERGIPYTTAPESSHILWSRSEWSGGTMGGQSGDISYYTGIAYEQYSGPQIVLEGRAYYRVQQPPRYGWYCIDLYTGETIYYNNNTLAMPTFGQVLTIMNPNQFGGFPYLWSTTGGTPVMTMGPFGPTMSYPNWDMFDAYSGNLICSIANVSTSGTQFRDEIGSICYVNFVNLGTSAAPNYYMQVWNTTEAIWWQPSFGVFPPKTLPNGTTNIPVTNTGNAYWTWRPATQTVYDGRNGFSMNVSVASILGPQNSVVNQTGTIRLVYPDQVVVGTDGRNDARGVVTGFLKGISLKAPDYGRVLWETTFTPPKATDDYPNSTNSGGVTLGASFPLAFSAISVPDGVFAFRETVTGKIWVYSLKTGQQLWTAKVTPQFYYYEHFVAINQGKVYTHGLSGVCNAYNATTGEFLWNFTAPSVGYLETPYEYTPLRLSFFADGKAYFNSLEGAGLNVPIRRDGSIMCVDTNTGEMLWRLTSWPGYSGNTMVISDGRIMYLDAHDNQIYCIGKGPSGTTVSAPQIAPTLGSSVMITGTVTDQSPSGRHNVAGDLDFALKGTPAIADESMDAWMEYMFHQRPIPGNATGVEVTLDTLDPNGNFVHIGTVTSDINGNYGYAFKPEVPGDYQIIATFAGSASYGPSTATTYLSVDEAPTATAPPEYPQPVDPTWTIVGVGIVLLIAIVIVGILTLRKK